MSEIEAVKDTGICLYETTCATWVFDEEKLHDVCPQLHAECSREWGRFLLLTPDPNDYETPTDSLIDYLLSAHERFHIKLDKKIWIGKVINCLS